MAVRTQTEEQFIKGIHLETVYRQAKAVDPMLWNTL